MEVLVARRNSLNSDFVVARRLSLNLVVTHRLHVLADFEIYQSLIQKTFPVAVVMPSSVAAVSSGGITRL